MQARVPAWPRYAHGTKREKEIEEREKRGEKRGKRPGLGHAKGQDDAGQSGCRKGRKPAARGGRRRGRGPPGSPSLMRELNRLGLAPALGSALAASTPARRARAMGGDPNRRRGGVRCGSISRRRAGMSPPRRGGVSGEGIRRRKKKREEEKKRGKREEKGVAASSGRHWAGHRLSIGRPKDGSVALGHRQVRHFPWLG